MTFGEGDYDNYDDEVEDIPAGEFISYTCK
jgi:hypothetical protein